MRYDAIVGEDFLTITDALEHFKTKNKSLILFIKGGYYKERLNINRPNITLIGDKTEKVIISYDTTAEDSEGRQSVQGTWSCATVIVSATNFCTENITFENCFDYPANELKDDNDPTKIKHAQAVAFMTMKGSNNLKCKNCSFISYQDTLFVDAGTHKFEKCNIYGHVDFIFGAGQALFEDCKIFSRNRSNKFPTGYIVAPSTLPDYPFGLIFNNCRLEKESDVPKGSVCLGRPWHPNADPKCSGSALFINCFMDDHIGELGYDKISAVNKEGNRIWFKLEPDNRFFEYGSFGPGALHSSTRPKLDEESLDWYKILISQL